MRTRILQIKDRHGNENIIFGFDDDQIIQWVEVYSEYCDEYVRVDMEHKSSSLNYLLMRCDERIIQEMLEEV